MNNIGQLVIDKIFKEEYEIPNSDILRDIYCITEYSNNNPNIFNSIVFKEESTKNINIVHRMIETLKYGLILKIENKISDLINWDIEPVKFNHIKDSVLYSSVEMNNTTWLPEICFNNMFLLEQKIQKICGLQILNLEAKTSSIAKITPRKCDPGYAGLDISMYFEITNFAYKIVYL